MVGWHRWNRNKSTKYSRIIVAMLFYIWLWLVFENFTKNVRLIDEIVCEVRLQTKINTAKQRRTTANTKNVNRVHLKHGMKRLKHHRSVSHCIILSSYA